MDIKQQVKLKPVTYGFRMEAYSFRFSRDNDPTMTCTKVKSCLKRPRPLAAEGNVKKKLTAPFHGFHDIR